MCSLTDRGRTLQAYGITASELEPAFDRIARIALRLTGARTATLVFGDPEQLLIVGAAGWPQPPLPSDIPRAPYAHLLGSARHALFQGDLALAVINSARRLPVGAICAKSVGGRSWTDEALEALADSAHVAEAELELRARRRPDELVTTILESMSDACVFLDRQWRYMYVNQRAGEIFQRDPRQLLGKHIWTEFPSGLGQKFHRAYMRAMEEQCPLEIEEYYPPWDKWFENRIHPSHEGLAIFFQDVTERRRTERHRARLERILEATKNVIATIEETEMLSYINAAGGALLGIDQAAVNSLPWQAVHAPHVRAQLQTEALAIARERGSWSGESTLLTQGGEQIAVHETIRWHPAHTPDTGFFSLVAVDIREEKRKSEERRLELEVRATAERMAHLGFWIWDIPSDRVTWSAELYRIYGLDETQFGASFGAYLNRVHPQDRKYVRESVERAVTERSEVSFEERIVRPDGSIRYLHSWGAVSLDDRGMPARMVGTCLDMTPLIETSRAMRRTEEWLALALEGAGMGVWEWDLLTDAVHWSGPTERIFGLAPGAFQGTYAAYLQTVYPDDRSRVEDVIRVCLESQTIFEIEYRVIRPDGAVAYVSARGRTYRDSVGRPVRMAGVVVDVTERKKLQEEQHVLSEQLVRAQKMDAIGRMAAGIGHDFNNLLTAILFLSDSLHDANADAAAQIRAVAERGAGLTQQLLALSRARSRTPTRLDLSQLVSASCRLLERILPPAVRLEAKLERTRDVCADRSQIDQVIMNLVLNARDALPDGGTIVVSTYDEGDQVTLEVRDDGTGMPPEIQSRIFEPFFTTKSEDRGTGLGLSVTQSIVKQRGGTIEVSSKVGAGSTFKVRLPAAASEALSKHPSEAPIDDHPSWSRILLVEPDSALRRLMHGVLALQGYRVTDVDDPYQALQVCQDRSHTLDLMITSSDLAGLSSTELTRRARQVIPQLKILLVAQPTARVDDQMATATIEKPFGPDTLVSQVQGVLGRSAKQGPDGAPTAR